jgi:hypothetical protein
MLPLSGCDALVGILLPSTVTVSLVNESPDYAVVVTLFYHDDDDVLEPILTEIGQEREYTIAPGQTVTFPESCDDLQAIVIDDADLRVLGGIGPETSSDVLRMDDDFECGDEITFTFTHSGALLDFDVDTAVQPVAW